MREGNAGGARRWPPHGWLGLGLVAVCWPLSWGLGIEDWEGRTRLLFFPQWLGYVLAVDALVVRRTGTSLLTRSRRDFALLFLASVPAWWLFELLNERLGNWEYVGASPLSTLEYALWASLSFSTVVPAVFETAELLRSFRWIDGFAGGPRMPSGRRALAAYLAIGALGLALLLAWPGLFYPLTWLSLVFLLDPMCRFAGRPALLDRLDLGDWRRAVALALGALVCGFFWELWNLYADPKWIYHTPGVESAPHLFEMPLPGYIGYLPFGLELWPLVHLVLPRPPRTAL